jgi:DNA-binding NtrC family response regulator
LESLGIRAGDHFLFACASMNKVMAAAERVAQSMAPALITGEAGTGKQALARWLHSRSARSGQPFTVLDCAAASPEWMESDLFGHEPGADGIALKRGALEQSQGGTLFLAAVEALPPAVQAKLAQVLQSGRFRRVGGETEIPVEARILAASRRDLESEARAGRFREDLLYRLNVARLHLPPLREREGDVLALAQYALRRACDAYNMNLATLSKAAEKALLKYRWPDNVRELENRVQRALLHSASRVIEAEALDLPRDAEEYGLMPLKAAREEAEHRAVQLALSKARGNLTLAASFLAIDRKVLRDVMERLGLQKEEFKPKPGG